MFIVPAFLFANLGIILVQLFQISMVDCRFTNKRFPTTVVTFNNLPHQNWQNGHVNAQEIPQTAETVSTDDVIITDQSFDGDTNTNKCPHCVCGTVHRKMRIVGGVPAEQNEFPWMVALSRKGKFYCGATLITKRHVLTAAHCVEGFTAKEIRASLGEYNRALKNDSSKMTVRIKQIIRHPEFQISNFKNDIAILKLDSQVPLDSPHIQPACLPSTENRNYTGLKATVTGWGRTGESKPPSNEMRKVEVPIMSMDECRHNSGYAPARITDNMMCAGYSNGQKDSCQGDSGGPLQIPGVRVGTMEVIGIVSWGRGCARPNFPGIYTRIESYVPWVDSNIDDECSCK